MVKMNSITWLGAVLALLGILGLAIPVSTTSHTEDVIKLGDLKVQGTKTTYHAVPQALSVGALVLGVVLIGAGVYSKRSR
jgi:drug/metabolite transporter (DMT)-like permease